MPPSRICFLSFVVVATTLIAGCQRRAEVESVAETLLMLQNEFGVAWPAIYTNEHGALVSGHRGASAVILRVDITLDQCELWQRSATNNLGEYQFAASPEPRFDGRFSWWDCSKIPSPKLTVYASRSNHPSGNLYVFVVPTNGICRMYIKALRK